MGVQYTRELSREAAERLLIDKLLREESEKIIIKKVRSMTDDEIEKALEEYFINYSIVTRG